MSFILSPAALVTFPEPPVILASALGVTLPKATDTPALDPLRLGPRGLPSGICSLEKLQGN